MFKIMIVEDDMKISQLLQSYLHKYGYQVVINKNFDEVMACFQKNLPELVLMDVNLPRYDGFYWCRQIRKVSTCPIIFISARDGKMDQVLALENGADDYITKPFDYDIVIAKIKSQLRRAYGTYATQADERTIECAGLVLYPERLMLSLHGKTVDLSHKEAKLLEALMEKDSRVVSRDRLLEKIWDDQFFIDDNTLNVYVTRVRKKLKELGIDEALETIRGTGYMFRPYWSERS